MEDVQESVCEMSEIMQSYASRGLTAAEVSASALFDQRQGEAEEAITFATQRFKVRCCTVLERRSNAMRLRALRVATEPRVLHVPRCDGFDPSLPNDPAAAYRQGETGVWPLADLTPWPSQRSCRVVFSTPSMKMTSAQGAKRATPSTCVVHRCLF